MPSRNLRRRQQTWVNPGEYREVVSYDEYFLNDFESLILFKYVVRFLCSEQHRFPEGNVTCCKSLIFTN